MTQQEIIEANRLLAEFLGFWETEETYFYNPYFEKGYKYEDMLFSSSWDWIMAVVQKIEFTEGCEVIISKYLVEIYKDNLCKSVCKIKTSKLDAVYDACITFVKWYNDNK